MVKCKVPDMIYCNIRIPVKMFVCAVFTGLFFGCESPQDVVFPEIKHLTAEKIPLKEIVYPEEVILADGHFVVSCSQTDSLLYFYTVPDLQFAGSGGRIGGGPDEFTYAPGFCGNRENRLILYGGFGPGNLRDANLDSRAGVTLGKWYKLGHPEIMNKPYIKGDTILIYSTLFNIKKYDLAHKRLLGEVYLREPGSENSTFNPDMGYLAANDTSAVYVYNYKNRIDLFDCETLKLKKSIIGPGQVKNGRLDSRHTNYYYVNVVATRSRFYAVKEAKNKSPENKHKYTLQVFDNHGNPVVEYAFDIPPGTFTVDELRGYIYSFNGNYQDYLLRYKL